MHSLLAVFLGVSAFAAASAASAATVIGGGLDAGWACPAGSGTCFDNRDFDVVPASASGTVTLTPTGLGAWDIDISLTVTSLTMTSTAGAIDSVDSILFTSMTYSVTGWSAQDFGDGNATGLGAKPGDVVGSYTQLDAASNPAVASTPIDFSVLSGTAVFFSNLVCDPSGVGQCGFDVGFFDDFVLPVGVTGGGTSYEFQHTFNVLIPEPSTAALLAFGLLTFSLRRRA